MVSTALINIGIYQFTFNRVRTNAAFHSICNLEAQIGQTGPPSLLASVPESQYVLILCRTLTYLGLENLFSLNKEGIKLQSYRKCINKVFFRNLCSCHRKSKYALSTRLPNYSKHSIYRGAGGVTTYYFSNIHKHA